VPEAGREKGRAIPSTNRAKKTTSAPVGGSTDGLRCFFFPFGLHPDDAARWADIARLLLAVLQFYNRLRAPAPTPRVIADNLKAIHKGIHRAIVAMKALDEIGKNYLLGYEPDFALYLTRGVDGGPEAKRGGQEHLLDLAFGPQLRQYEDHVARSFLGANSDGSGRFDQASRALARASARLDWAALLLDRALQRNQPGAVRAARARVEEKQAIWTACKDELDRSQQFVRPFQPPPPYSIIAVKLPELEVSISIEN
jgi:hypothetical protein